MENVKCISDISYLSPCTGNFSSNSSTLKKGNFRYNWYHQQYYTNIINYFYRISIPDTGFSETASVRALNSWIHLTIVFRSLIDGEGFFFYFNGQLIVDDISSTDPITSSGNLPGKMTLGSRSPNMIQSSGNIMLVDEILLWDEQLDAEQIRHLAILFLSEDLWNDCQDASKL